VVENISEMILVLNSEGKILDANFAAIRILHVRSRKRLIGRAFSEMVFDKDNNPVNWDDYCESFHIEDTSEGPHIQRLQCLAKVNERDKLEIDIAISSIQVDEVPMMIVLGRDVTEENRLAREKEELSIRLAHTQRLESIGELAGGVAHDFNNYIHAIQGHLDVITYMHEVADEKVTGHLEKINDITEKAAHLTQQLLGFARKGKYIRKSINLNDLIKESVELFTPKSLEDMNFNLEIAGGDPMWVKGDPVQLQQVFLNLLINARDAVEGNEDRDKEISMQAKDAALFNIRIKPNLEMKKVDLSDFYCIEVKDNGCGVSQEDIERIFEPFYTTKPFGKGTGMGLAMVYGTVSNHGGWVQVLSEQGKGSAFYVFLPRC
jgi:signal transduction histidine kinase